MGGRKEGEERGKKCSSARKSPAEGSFSPYPYKDLWSIKLHFRVGTTQRLSFFYTHQSLPKGCPGEEITPRSRRYLCLGKGH